MVEFVYEHFADRTTVKDIMVPVLTAAPSSTVADVLSLLDNPLNERHQQVFLQDGVECLGICNRDDSSFAASPPSDLAIEHCGPNDLKLSECVGPDLTVGEFIETSQSRDSRWVVKHGIILGWVDIFQLESHPVRICLFALLSDLDACLKDLLLTYMMAHHLRLELQGVGGLAFTQVQEAFLRVLTAKRRCEVKKGMGHGRELLNSVNFDEKHRMLRYIFPRLYDNYCLALGGPDFFPTTTYLRNRLAHGEPFLNLVDGDDSTHVSEYVSTVMVMRHRLLRYSRALRSALDSWVANDGPHTPSGLYAVLKAVPFHT